MGQEGALLDSEWTQVMLRSVAPYVDLSLWSTKENFLKFHKSLQLVLRLEVVLVVVFQLQDPTAGSMEVVPGLLAPVL